MHFNTIPSSCTISCVFLMDIFLSFESFSFDFTTPASFLGRPGFDTQSRFRLLAECLRVYSVALDTLEDSALK
jgi:hypothetical protein